MEELRRKEAKEFWGMVLFLIVAINIIVGIPYCVSTGQRAELKRNSGWIQITPPPDIEGPCYFYENDGVWCK